ncbi:MAG: YkgJ family cysteine cluster protein [Methanosarcina sp.]|jgi:Fe-S-cluster containining protein|nr:YkgJ family cysteine cluster protein [Methanosarcina sp.]MDD4523711.1 YkgJ family cysteine cluster protein [Methanosarcina sp.]
MYQKDTSLYMEASSAGEKWERSKKRNYQLLLIADLKKEIEMARKLDPEHLAAEIQKIGFSCHHCGKCCKRAFGDNRVAVIPSEIERIREYTGLSKLEVAGPFVPEVPVQDETWEDEEEHPETSFRPSEENDDQRLSEENEELRPLEENEEPSSLGFLESLQEYIDSEGKIHAFGWILRRKRNGDCIFLERDTHKCRVYPVRPMLCSTYPFYIEELRLQICECEGLRYPISAEDSRKLAENLLLRYVSELEDTCAVYEKFMDFRREEKGLELAKTSLENGTCAYIVHDSNGINEVID